MIPTKVTRARKRTAKKPTNYGPGPKERGVKGNPVLDKLMKLKYRINDAYNHRQENDGDTKSDKTWVMEEITNLRQGGWLSATKMKVANEMWSKYGG